MLLLIEKKEFITHLSNLFKMEENIFLEVRWWKKLSMRFKMIIQMILLIALVVDIKIRMDTYFEQDGKVISR